MHERHLRLVAVDGRVSLDTPRPTSAPPTWLPEFRPDRTLPDNVRLLALAVAGAHAAAHAETLAHAVLDRFPDAGHGKQKRGWVATIVWVAADLPEAENDLTELLRIDEQVLAMTDISMRTIDRRIRDLAGAELLPLRVGTA